MSSGSPRLRLVNGAAYRALSIGVAAAALAHAPGAWAQASSSAASAAQPPAVGEVVVTAQRRATLLSKTPVAVTAISGEEIDKQGIHTSADLAKTVPGLTLPGGVLNNLAAVTIRGISIVSNTLTLNYPVAYYTDGLFSDRPYSALDNLFDVDSIQVLRGPQGVLFGRNATAGAIVITHRLPGETPTLLARAELGSFGTRAAQVSVTGPIVGDKLMGGLALNYRHVDGWTHNTLTGDTSNGGDTKGVRGTLRYVPTDRLEIIARANYNHDVADYAIKNIVSFGADVKGAFSNDPAFGKYDFANDTPDTSNRKSGAGSLETRYRFDKFDFITLTGYQQFHQSSLADSDGSAQQLGVNIQNNVDYSSWSTEWRASSNDKSDALQWDTGIYFSREVPHEFGNSVINYNIVAGKPVIANGTVTNDNKVVDHASAIFGQVNYRFTDQLSGHVGGRYNVEEKHFLRDQVTLGANGAQTPAKADVKHTWKSFTPNAGLEYNFTPQTLAYASVSNGFKGGGFNITPGTPTFDPEKVWNYELGLKTAMFDRRVRLNFDVFDTKYKDMQVTQNIGSGVALVQNAAQSTLKGVEFEGTVLPPIEGLQLNATFAYLDAKYDKYILDANNPTTTNLAGYVLNRAPKWKGSVIADYTHPLGNDFQANFRAAYNWESAIYFESLAQPVRSQFRRPGINNTDLRIGVGPTSGKWEVAGVMRNATDEQYFSTLQAFFGVLVHGAFFNQPRYTGIELNFKM